MKHQIGPPFIDRLRQEVASQKRKNFQPLPGEGIRNRRVMEEGDLLICLKMEEGLFQLLRQRLRVMDKGLHLRLAKSGAAGPFESSPEPFGPCDADRNLTASDHDALPFEDGDVCLPEERGDLLLLIIVVVMVS